VVKIKYYLWVMLTVLVAFAYWYGTRGELTVTAASGESQKPKAKANPTVLAQPAVAAPATPIAGNTAVAATALVEDPQKDLKTAIPDIIRRTRLGEFAWETYTLPAELAKRTPEEIEGARQAKELLQRDPEIRQDLQKSFDVEAAAYEALENQIPAYNAAGDEATYSFHRPAPDDLGHGTLTQATPPEALTFIRVDGKWYFKPKAQMGEYIFPIFKMLQDTKKLMKPENGS